MSWRYTTPAVLVLLLAASVVQGGAGGGAGWLRPLLTTATPLPLPVLAGLEVGRAASWGAVWRPRQDWGPSTRRSRALGDQ